MIGASYCRFSHILYGFGFSLTIFDKKFTERTRTKKNMTTNEDNFKYARSYTNEGPKSLQLILKDSCTAIYFASQLIRVQNRQQIATEAEKYNRT